jgi:hypothetical protein
LSKCCGADIFFQFIALSFCFFVNTYLKPVSTVKKAGVAVRISEALQLIYSTELSSSLGLQKGKIRQIYEKSISFFFYGAANSSSLTLWLYMHPRP